MPLIAMRLSDNLFSQIKDLVEKELYISPEAFLEIAAFNQLALERGSSPTEIIQKGHRKRPSDEGSNGEPNQTRVSPGDREQRATTPTKTTSPRRAAEPVPKGDSPPEPTIREEDYTAAFERLALVARVGTVPPVRIDSADLSSERIFGQVNRYLPMKIACRWLARLAATDGKWPRFDAISERLADDAATIGSLLEMWDAESERKRDELLATGLPRRRNTASKDRFLSQNIARATRGGEIYPATICQYQFARFDDGVIALTEQGVAFAHLENSILDKQDSKSLGTLESKETEFLVHHILTWVLAERDDMRLVLRAIKGGKNTPTELMEALRSQFPTDWSDNVFQTHVSGLVARLGELRLMKRVWQGRNVHYELAEQKQIETFLIPS